MDSSPSTSRLERSTPWIVVALLAAYWLMAVSASRSHCNTYDEIAHLTSGVSHWRTGDYRLNPEQGALPQRLEALPVAFGPFRFPSLEQDAWYLSDEFDLGRQFFFESGNDPDAMLLRARSMNALLGVLAGLATFLWSRRLWGARGGLLSLTLFTFSPTLLAHGGVSTADMAVTLTMTLSVLGSWAVMQRVTWATVAFGSLALGSLFLSKASAAIALPIGLGLLLVRLARGGPLPVPLLGRDPLTGRAGQLLVLGAVFVVHAAVVVTLIWAAFGFRYSPFVEAEPGRDRLAERWEALDDAGGVGASALGFARRHRLLPEAYLWGLAHAGRHAQSRRAFAGGSFGSKGWWWFFPYAFAIKTPLPLLVLLGLGVAAVAFSLRPAGPGASASSRAPPRPRWELAPPLLLVAIYWAGAMSLSLNIGHRHVMVSYPALLVLAGGAVVWMHAERRWARVAVPGLVLALVAASVWVRPHYLEFFNTLVGGPSHGWKSLVDSSLDWGQDLPALRDRLAARESGSPIYLSYFGTAVPERYGIAVRPLPGWPERGPREPMGLEPGTYCIGATMLQPVYGRAWGPWTEEREREYRELRSSLGDDLPAEEREALWQALRGRNRRSFRNAWYRYEWLRFRKLTAALRARNPDDAAGYSMLIYEVGREELGRALAPR